MKFRVHYMIEDMEDSFIIEAETIEEIRKKAAQELYRRGGIAAWSEEIP